MSDIVFLNTWYAMEPEKYYNPVLSYQDIRLMKTTWELRKERMITPPVNPDSEYKEIERKKRVFNPLVIPKVKILPYLIKIYLVFRSQSSICIQTEATPKREER